MNVVITIPAYNESKTLGKVISDIKDVMQKGRDKFSVIVVDDGSRDATAEVARDNGAIVYSHPSRMGLAEAFRSEMQQALKLKPDIIVHTDADGQYLASEIPKLLKPVEEKKADLVLGSRFKGTIERMSLLKRMGNKAFSRLISNITRIRVSDSQTGFRAFTGEVAENINIISNFTYTQEQIIRAARQKFRIQEVPIHFAKRGGRTKSRLMKNPLDFALKAWINLFRIYRDYEPLKFFGFIGSLFFGAGFLIGLWFVYLHFTTGITGHLGLIFLMLLLITTGLQVILFGFMADMLRK